MCTCVCTCVCMCVWVTDPCPKHHHQTSPSPHCGLQNPSSPDPNCSHCSSLELVNAIVDGMTMNQHLSHWTEHGVPAGLTAHLSTLLGSLGRRKQCEIPLDLTNAPCNCAHVHTHAHTHMHTHTCTHTHAHTHAHMYIHYRCVHTHACKHDRFAHTHTHTPHISIPHGSHVQLVPSVEGDAA